MQPVWCHLYLSTIDVIVGVNDSRICSVFFGGGRIKSISEDPAAHRALDSELFDKIQVSGSALGKNNKKQCMSRCDFYTLISVDPAFRIPGDLRPGHQEVKG